jgi:two-component system, OmpR family, sensor histidine kinase CpxA
VTWVAVMHPPVEPYPWGTLAGIVGAVALMAWLLHRHIAAPLRRLSGAVERFGRGDLAARSGLARGDEIGQLSRAFDEMAERIDGLMTSERRLLQDVSHELRTPLARLRFAVEVARTDPDRETALDRIRKECDRLALLTDELLRFSASEGEAQVLQAVDAGTLLREIAGDCALEAEAKGVGIAVRVEALGEVLAARELLRRAVENVVRNAIRFSPEGSEVEIAGEHGAEAITITVRDHGPGVPAGEEEKIFRPLYRVEEDRGRDTGGAGLGLAIARRAIERHHGTITAENAHPGLRVRITLPAQTAAAD